MTKAGRENLLALAIVVSAIVHIVLMILASNRVMAHMTRGIPRAPHAVDMRLRDAKSAPDPVRIEAIRELAALREAPAVPTATNYGIDESAIREIPAPTVEIAEPSFPDATELPTHLDEHKIDLSENLAVRPALHVLETPSVKADAVPAPAFSPAVASVPVARPLPPPVLPAAAPEIDPTTFGDEKKAPEFTPQATVSEEVDEVLVKAEKDAVRDLLGDLKETRDLERFVNVAVQSLTRDGWTYFNLLISPRAALKTVPKDFVLILDVSGSIGSDRLASIRKAAKRLLHESTNTGDRFNLVAFRDRYSYAFRSWQPCSASAFDAAERWLNNQAAHGRTDVFATISSALTLPRDPKRPLIALVVTDGDANEGVSETSEILSRFTELNDGLISIYMYGVASYANRELIDVLTHGNRGESFVYEGFRWNAGNDLNAMTERFRDPVLSDLRLVFASESPAEAYPARLKNIYRGETLSVIGRVKAGTKSVAFSLRGLNGAKAFEGYFKLPLAASASATELPEAWQKEHQLDARLHAISNNRKGK